MSKGLSNSVSPPPFKPVNGITVPGVVTQEQVDRIHSLPLRPDDVWIVTYPKAGTTWTQNIVRLIFNNGIDDGKKLNEAVPWIEALNTNEHFFYQLPIPIDEMPSPRAFKSHFLYHNMPCGVPSSTPRKYIYVARNPKDVAVSYFHHYIGFKYTPAGGPSWEEFFRWFINGDMAFGDFFDHVLSWWTHKDDENVLFLKYEDMKENLPATVTQIAEFIGHSIEQSVIDKIADQTTFEKMRVNPGTNYGWATHRRDPTAPSFMRKGVVGDWTNYFTPEQSAQMDEKIALRTAGSGLEFKYS